MPCFYRSSYKFLLAACWLLSFDMAAQTTIRVPQDQPTIQGAIDAANDGDTVLVSPGTYYVTLDYEGKAITVTTGATTYSSPVVTQTTLLPASTYSIVSFYHGEGRGSVLNGFTITDPTRHLITETFPSSKDMVARRLTLQARHPQYPTTDSSMTLM